MLHQGITWAIQHQDALLALVGGAAGLSVLAQGVLHKILTKWPIASEIWSKVFSYSFVQLLTLITALSAYKLQGANFGVVYPWLATAVTAIHRFLVSPYYTKKVLPYIEYQASANASKGQSLPQSQVTAAQAAQPAAPAPAFLG